jgi:hypothetical protein
MLPFLTQLLGYSRPSKTPPWSPSGFSDNRNRNRPSQLPLRSPEVPGTGDSHVRTIGTPIVDACTLPMIPCQLGTNLDLHDLRSQTYLSLESPTVGSIIVMGARWRWGSIGIPVGDCTGQGYSRCAGAPSFAESPFVASSSPAIFPLSPCLSLKPIFQVNYGLLYVLCLCSPFASSFRPRAVHSCVTLFASRSIFGSA